MYSRTKEGCALRWLVDGMNVIGSRPDGWWRDRQAAVASLAARLSDYQRRTGDDVTVVFDGHPPPEPIEGEALAVFAPGPGPNRADDEIVRLVSADTQPETLSVVTSDQALADRVQALGARVVGAGAFRAQLEDQ